MFLPLHIIIIYIHRCTQGLVFINGAFRHRWTLENPSPPPVPFPPPGMNYGKSPPIPSPPPISPPPYYLGSKTDVNQTFVSFLWPCNDQMCPCVLAGENCIPLPTLASAGLDTGRESVLNAHTEERASCLYVKRILDFTRQASHCFSSVSNPSPPPPPPNNGIRGASKAIKHNLDRQTNGERFVDGRFYHRPQDSDDVEAATRAENALVSVREQIKEIGEANPILRSILNGAIQELEDTASSNEAVTGNEETTKGRRLLVRRDYVHTIAGALSTHAVQGAVGVQGIPGVTQLSCEALCEAATRDVDAETTPTDACHAYAFRRDSPFSMTDLTGHCWLLQNAGACKSEVRCNNLIPTDPAHTHSTPIRKLCAYTLWWLGERTTLLLERLHHVFELFFASLRRSHAEGLRGADTDAMVAKGAFFCTVCSTRLGSCVLYAAGTRSSLTLPSSFLIF